MAIKRVQVFSPSAMHSSLEALAAAHRERGGDEVALAFETAPAFVKRLETGQQADVLMATPSLMKDLFVLGKVHGDSRLELGRVGVGVVVRKGAPRPDISTTRALTAALHDADSIVYNRASSGMSRRDAYCQAESCRGARSEDCALSRCAGIVHASAAGPRPRDRFRRADRDRALARQGTRSRRAAATGYPELHALYRGACDGGNERSWRPCVSRLSGNRGGKGDIERPRRDRTVNASALDPALWITWYDLAPHDREAYLCWLHEQYMPKLVERPGVLWTAHYASEPRPPLTTKSHGRSRRHAAPEAVPQGHEFILLVGGEGPHVFSDPTPAQFEASLGPGERQMLALRNALASNVMLEHLRIEGPEAPARKAGRRSVPASSSAVSCSMAMRTSSSDGTRSGDCLR